MRPHPFFLILAMSIFMMMLVPLSSMAQETESNDSSSHVYSKQDNFGGWRLGGDILFGTGRCDDKGCIGHPEDDFDQKNYSLSVMLQFEAGYFWGENVFFGPVVDVSIGMPMFTNVDIRYKIIFPFIRYVKFIQSVSTVKIIIVCFYEIRVVVQFFFTKTAVTVSATNPCIDDNSFPVIRQKAIPKSWIFRRLFP